MYKRQISKREEVIWLVGYSAIVLNEAGKRISDDFLCHNNLDLYDGNTLPWKSSSKNSFERLFTLTAGQTNIRLPHGTGIPVTGNTTLAISSQALNHNYPDTTLSTRQKVTVYYVRESECEGKMKALEQKAIFVTKKINDISEPTSVKAKGSEHLSCVNTDAGDPISPTYKDSTGFRLTGHWNLSPGREEILADVTHLLDLRKDNRIYYVGVHVHPFSQTLALEKTSSAETIFSARNTNLSLIHI